MWNNKLAVNNNSIAKMYAYWDDYECNGMYVYFGFGMFSVCFAMNGTKHRISEMNPNMIEFSI